MPKKKMRTWLASPGKVPAPSSLHNKQPFCPPRKYNMSPPSQHLLCHGGHLRGADVLSRHAAAVQLDGGGGRGDGRQLRLSQVGGAGRAGGEGAAPAGRRRSRDSLAEATRSPQASAAAEGGRVVPPLRLILGMVCPVGLGRGAEAGDTSDPGTRCCSPGFVDSSPDLGPAPSPSARGGTKSAPGLRRRGALLIHALQGRRVGVGRRQRGLGGGRGHASVQGRE